MQATTERGSDLLDVVTIPDNVGLGTVVLEIELNPVMSVRLERTTSRYQRIKWLNTTFRIVPGYSSMAAGQYAAAVVRDPTDEAPEDPVDQIRWINGQRISAIAKWWEPMRLTVPGNGDLLWTSIDNEKRWYSPGKLFVMCMGPPLQAGSIAVYLDWQVHLSEPSVEKVFSTAEEESQVVLPYDMGIVPYPGNTTQLYYLLI